MVRVATMTKIVVVGLGYWGPNIVRVLRQIDDVEVWVYDQDPEQTKYFFKNKYGSWRDVLADETVDALAIATPITSHFMLVRDALECDKHVFVEKPLATDWWQARELEELAWQKGKILMPGHVFLYSPAVNYIRGLIRGWHLGAIQSISMTRFNQSIHTTEADVLWDLGPHDFSILYYWMDALPTKVQTIGNQYTRFITMNLSGIPVSIQLSWMAPEKTRYTTIVGNEGMVIYDDTKELPVSYYRGTDVFPPVLDQKEPLLSEMEDFVSAITNTAMNQWQLRSSARFGVEVVKMLSMVEMAK